MRCRSRWRVSAASTTTTSRCGGCCGSSADIPSPPGFASASGSAQNRGRRLDRFGIGVLAFDQLPQRALALANVDQGALEFRQAAVQVVVKGLVLDQFAESALAFFQALEGGVGLIQDAIEPGGRLGQFGSD